MTLNEKQFRFARELAKLLQEAERLGFDVTMGEVWRSPETAMLYARQGKGIVNSLHCKRLAVDLNLFRNKKYLTDTESYRQLGEWWESQSTDDCQMRWGGHFSKRADGNHFEIVG